MFKDKPKDHEEDELTTDLTETKKFDQKGLFYKRLILETENWEIGTVFLNEEYKFMTLREWTLYDAIKYSNYMATKMQLWTIPGLN